MTEAVGVMKAPCKSCPYRRDVPSGVWASEEYEKLPTYDGEMVDQIMKGGTGIFMCHQRDGNLCAGWVGCHGSDNLIALRLSRSPMREEVWGYESPIPLFASGQEACDHGKAEIMLPGEKAKRMTSRLSRTVAGVVFDDEDEEDIFSPEP